jgi:hypothetical protein
MKRLIKTSLMLAFTLVVSVSLVGCGLFSWLGGGDNSLSQSKVRAEFQALSENENLVSKNTWGAGFKLTSNGSIVLKASDILAGLNGEGVPVDFSKKTTLSFDTRIEHVTENSESLIWASASLKNGSTDESIVVGQYERVIDGTSERYLDIPEAIAELNGPEMAAGKSKTTDIEKLSIDDYDGMLDGLIAGLTGFSFIGEGEEASGEGIEEFLKLVTVTKTTKSGGAYDLKFTLKGKAFLAKIIELVFMATDRVQPSEGEGSGSPEAASSEESNGEGSDGSDTGNGSEFGDIIESLLADGVLAMILDGVKSVPTISATISFNADGEIIGINVKVDGSLTIKIKNPETNKYITVLDAAINLNETLSPNGSIDRTGTSFIDLTAFEAGQ